MEMITIPEEKLYEMSSGCILELIELNILTKENIPWLLKKQIEELNKHFSLVESLDGSSQNKELFK